MTLRFCEAKSTDTAGEARPRSGLTAAENRESTRRPIALFEPARRLAAQTEYQLRVAEYEASGTSLSRLRMMVARDRWLALFDAPIQRPQNDDEPTPRKPPPAAARNEAPKSFLQMIDEMKARPRMAG